MSRIHPFLLACSLLIQTVAWSQKQLTLADAVLKAGTELAPDRLRGLQWVKDSPTYSYVKDNELLVGTLGKSMDRAVASLHELNVILPDSARLRGFPSITWVAPHRFRFMHQGALYLHDTRTRTCREVLRLPASAEDVEFAPDGVGCAFVSANDVFIADTTGRGAQRVTSDGTDGVVNGKSVHREEYGITKGLFWGPRGGRLAFYRMDERMVTPYQLETIETKPSTFKTIRYPMAGQTSHQVQVGVYEVATGRSLFLETGEPLDQYLTNISWSPDETEVWVMHLDRATTNARLVRYDARTGRPIGTALERRRDDWVEPQHPAIALEGKPGRYLLRQEVDGFEHLHLYDVGRGRTTAITKGPWVVGDVLGQDGRGGHIVVEGTGIIQPNDPTGALENHLYRVHADGRATRLTTVAGTHHGQLSSDGRYVIDQWSSLMVPARIDVIDVVSGQVVKTLLNSADPLRDHRKGSVELLHVPGTGGSRLNARLIKPSHFDPARKYPVLVYVYGGPHAQLVSNSHLGGAPLWMLEAAERGYLVWTLDNHGSANRGPAFERVIHRRLGEVERQDQLLGIDHLRALPYVDADRLAVHGWSYGGFMTTGLMLHAPGTFKVGVAGGPVMDWALYEVMYTERYMDTPAENPDGYTSARLSDRCGDLKGELLIIHGLEDDVVVPQHSYSFLGDCVRKGKQVEFFVYPGHAHNVRGRDRLHLMQQVLDRIDRTIRP